MTRTHGDDWESVAFLLLCSSALLLILGGLSFWIGVRSYRRPASRDKYRGGLLILASCLCVLTCYWTPSVAFRHHFGSSPLNHSRSRSDEEIGLIGMTEESVLRHLGPPHLVNTTEHRTTWIYWCDSFCLDWEAVVFGPDGKVMGRGIN